MLALTINELVPMGIWKSLRSLANITSHCFVEKSSTDEILSPVDPVENAKNTGWNGSPDIVNTLLDDIAATSCVLGTGKKLICVDCDPVTVNRKHFDNVDAFGRPNNCVASSAPFVELTSIVPDGTSVYDVGKFVTLTSEENVPETLTTPAEDCEYALMFSPLRQNTNMLVV